MKIDYEKNKNYRIRFTKNCKKSDKRTNRWNKQILMNYVIIY